MRRCGLLGRHGLHNGVLGFRDGRCFVTVFRAGLEHRFRHLMAFLGQEGFHLIIPDSNHLKVGRFHIGIGNDHDPHAIAGFDGRDVRALFVQKERRDGHGNDGANPRTPLLQRFFLQNPQHGEGEGAHVTDDPLPRAPGADDGRGLF